MTQAQLQQALLQECLSRYDGTFASGVTANNKLDFDRLESETELYDEVVRRLGKLASAYQPEMVIGVPDGATRIAFSMAQELDISWLPLSSAKLGRGKIGFREASHSRRCLIAKKVVVVEDIFNRFTSTRQVLAIPEIGLRAVAALAVWDRGVELPRDTPEIPTQALVSQHIPAMLEPDSTLWRSAKG